MTFLFAPPNPPLVGLGDAGDMGDGVFALRDIEAGEMLLRDPVVRFKAADWPLIRQTDLGPVAFLDRQAYRRNKYRPELPCPGFFAEGYSSKINHSDTPNADLAASGLPGCINVVAIEDIEAGAQVFIRYVNAEDPRLYEGMA